MRSVRETAWRDAFSIVIQRTRKSIFFKRDAGTVTVIDMRKTYIITYDLTEDDSYEDLFEYFKEFGTWARISKSVWAVKSSKSASTIRDEIADIVSDEANIFIIRSGKESAWKNVICHNQWLKTNL